MEDLIIRHGVQFVDGLEQARRDERFRFALRRAWFDQRADPTIAARLRRFDEPPQHRYRASKKVTSPVIPDSKV